MIFKTDSAVLSCFPYQKGLINTELTRAPCVLRHYAEGFKKPFLKPGSHEGLWECGGALKKITHRSYFSAGRETESSFPHIPLRVCLV